MKVQIVTYGKHREVEYTNGAHQFFMHHSIQHSMKGDFIVVNAEEVEVQANTLPELQDLAVKYNAAIIINSDCTISIEFV